MTCVHDDRFIQYVMFFHKRKIYFNNYITTTYLQLKYRSLKLIIDRLRHRYPSTYLLKITDSTGARVFFSVIRDDNYFYLFTSF